MFTSTILSTILAFQLLTTQTIYVKTLPITSKPIEGTAEHLAWQAWLELPPEQKNLEKSRKVTPKSIFTLPFRECPPGHQLFENRCIPTVNIDQTALLTQQLLGFVVGDNNGDNNYEFDYDDIVGDEIADVMYEPAQKLNGDDSSKDSYHYDQLPSQDEPLKFNIFQQKFPTDYETEQMPSDEPAEETTKSTTVAVNATEAFTTQQPKLNATQSKNSSITDLQMEGSNISMNIAQHTSNDTNNSDDMVTRSTEFSISDIDAIVLPAVPTQTTKLESSEQNSHKFSLFKDDSRVQLVTSTLLAERNNEQQQKQPDLTELLKADNLLPLPNITVNAVTNKTDNAGSSATEKSTTIAATSRTRTSSVFNDNEVSTLSSVFSRSTDTTTQSSGSSIDEFGGVTDMMLTDTEASLPPIRLDDLLEDVEKVGIREEPLYDHLKKEEHPRSIKNQNASSAMTEPQEKKFSTTTEPDTTTNFQVDDTTVQEIHDAPTIALKELLELAQHPYTDIRENLGSVVKKSKVEPVELPPIEFSEVETDSSVMTTVSTQSAPTSATSSPNLAVTKAESEKVTLLLTTPTPSFIKTDRFDNQQESNIASTVKYGNQQPDSKLNDEQLDDSNFRNTKTTAKSTTTRASEIDIKQELRMINELVKGNSKIKQQNKGGIIKSEIISTAEKSSPDAAVKSLKAIASSNKDKIVENAIQQSTSTSIKEESRIGATKITSTPTYKTYASYIPKYTDTTKETNETTTLNEPTATIWSKIMPFIGFSTSFDESASESTQTTEATEKTLSEESTTSFSVSPIIKTISNSKNLENSFRSNKNSKIVRINSLSKINYNSSSNNSSSESRSSISNNNVAEKLLLSTTESSTTTTEINDSSTTTSSSSAVLNESFWWLPIGWRLERAIRRVGTSEPSLLFSLWPSVSARNGTSKLRK